MIARAMAAVSLFFGVGAVLHTARLLQEAAAVFP